MNWLELKIPPPVVALFCAWVIWRFPAIGPVLTEAAREPVAMVLAALGLACDMAAIAGFLRARTTINPMRPTGTSTLVEQGIYRLTRNPMYLGLALLLSAWCIWRGPLLAAMVIAAFVIYITRFQILPEERVLAARFPDSYPGYCSRVRRWL